MNKVETSPLPLIGDENQEGIRISYAELKAQIPHYSRLYGAIVAAVQKRLESRLGVPPAASAVLAREALVSPIHFYMDRLLRTERFARLRPGQSLHLTQDAAPAYPDLMEQFRVLTVSSEAFNHALLARVAALAGVAVTVAGPATTSAAPWPPQPGFVNHNFVLYSRLEKARRKARFWLSRALAAAGLSRTRPCPTLSMAYATEALQNAGFYPSLLESVRGRAVLTAARPRDPSLRDAVVAAAARESRGEVARFLEAAGSTLNTSRVNEDFAGFLAQAYPSSLLEAAADNLEECKKVLRPFAPAPFLVSEVNTLEPTCMIAAARSLAMPVVGCQHGGHYGYLDLEENPYPMEIEFGYYDCLVTWGWEELPASEACRNLRLVPLPNPWLSERRRYWRYALSKNQSDCKKPFDLLLLSNKTFRFPPSPSWAAMSRPDHAREFSRLLVNLAQACATAGVRLLHKPYNRATASLLISTLAAMERVGGDCYRALPVDQKGLSPQLLKQCNAVLWDQPGTGLLECLASGIPTLALWPRTCNREAPWAGGLLAALEETGVLHRSPESLLAAYARLRPDPAGWLREPAREHAIAAFCRRAAWASDDWPERWRAFLSSRSHP